MPLGADAIQRPVLGLVLQLHPLQLTLDELVHEMSDAPDDFGSRDRIENAVRHLARS